MNRHNFTFVQCFVALLVLSGLVFTILKFQGHTAELEELSATIGTLQNQNVPPNTHLVTEPKLNPYVGSLETVISIPRDAELRKMGLIELEDLYMRYIENIQQACGRTRHMGGEVDGGYHICEKYLAKDKCLVYSFGSFRMFDFEDDIAKAYGCEIHTFDPFDGQEDHIHSKHVTFHKLGIANQDKDSLLTLTTIKKMLSHSHKVIDVLKIDCEGAEWGALPNIVSSGELGKVKTLIVEFHLCIGSVCTDRAFRTEERYANKLSTLRAIYAQGFRLYFVRLWTGCKLKDERGIKKTGCHEVHFMNINL